MGRHFFTTQVYHRKLEDIDKQAVRERERQGETMKKLKEQLSPEEQISCKMESS